MLPEPGAGAQPRSRGSGGAEAAPELPPVRRLGWETLGRSPPQLRALMRSRSSGGAGAAEAAPPRCRCWSRCRCRYRCRPAHLPAEDAGGGVGRGAAVRALEAALALREPPGALRRERAVSTGRLRAARPRRGATTGGPRLCGPNRTGPHGARHGRDGSGALTWKEPEASGCAGADIPGGTHRRSRGDPGGAAPHRTAALRGEGPRRRHCRAPHHTGPPGRPGRPRPRPPAPAPIPAAAAPRPRSWAATGRHRQRSLPTTRSAAGAGRSVPGNGSPPGPPQPCPRVCGDAGAPLPASHRDGSRCHRAPSTAPFATPTPSGTGGISHGVTPPEAPAWGGRGRGGLAAHPPHAPCPRRARGVGRSRCCGITGPEGQNGTGGAPGAPRSPRRALPPPARRDFRVGPQGHGPAGGS